MIVLLVGLLLAGYFVLALLKPVPAAGIALGLAPAYLIRFEVAGIPTNFLELTLLTFVLAVAIRTPRWAYREALRKIGKVWIMAALFALAGAVSVVISPEKARALGQYKAFIIEPLLFFAGMLLTVKDEEDAKTVVNWLFGSASIVAIFGIIQYYTGVLLPIRFWGNGIEPRRISSFFEYPNALALYLAPLVVFYLTLILNGKLAKKSLILLVPSFVALGLTFSRGGWLGFAAGAAVALSMRYSPKKVVLGIVALVLLIGLIPTSRTRILSSFNDRSSAAHWELTKAGVSIAKDSPLFGNGLYGFRSALQRSGFRGEILNYPHNIFLNFWLETGLLGLLSFLAMNIFFAYQAIKRPAGYRRALLAFLVAIWLHGLFDAPYFKNDLALLYWALSALAFL